MYFFVSEYCNPDQLPQNRRFGGYNGIKDGLQ